MKYFVFLLISSLYLPSLQAQDNDSAWRLIGMDKAAHFASFHHPVKVAIVDDGFDIDNPLWAASIAHNPKDIPGNNVDEDHNGKIDDYTGWDFGDNDEDVRPARNFVEKESHGTRVLGIFWQVLQELSADGARGISILPIKAVSDGHLNNYLVDGYKGIEYALDQKADVIICSWSGPSISADEKAILARAQARGTIIIAAAGNFYSMQPLYPGAFPSVIDVAATNDAGQKMGVSNYGNFVDISAPGDSLLTYDPYGHNPTARISATSAATPVVAAVVVALKAGWPALSAAAIERLLKNTATPLEAANPLYMGGLGAGMLNIAGIRNALTGETTAAHTQVQGYVDLRKLQAMTPTRIVPAGKYPGIKFVLQSASAGVSAGLPAVRMTLYRSGHGKDTVVKAANMRFPMLAIADSIYLYSAAHGPAASTTESWWYYSAMTIDSSNFYCGGTVPIAVNGEGCIEDGSAGADYTGRNDCKWQLTAPAGKKLQLSFEQFDTEPKIDQVYLFSGNSTKDPILAIFSGHKLPPVIKSWNEQVLIWFITDEQNNFQGWRLHYKCVD
jgi:hypothetical protein